MPLNLLLCLFLFFVSSVSYASTDKFSLFYYRPAFGESDYQITLGTNSLRRNQWRLGTEFDYGFHPLEITNNSSRVRGVVDHLFTQHLEGAFAPFNWWEIDLQLPVIWINDFIQPVFPPPAAENKMGVGDMLLRNRFTIFRSTEHPLGLAVIPFVTIPTGNENHFVGDKYPTGGGLVAVDSNLGKRVSIGLNVGAEARQHVVYRDLDMKSRFLASGALGVKITDDLKAKGDVYTATPFNHFFSQQVSTPVELLLGLDYKFGESGFNANIGSGLSMVRSAGMPLFRAIAGLSYTSKAPKIKKAPEKAAVPAKEIEKTVHFGFDSFKIPDEDALMLSRIADMLMEHPEVKYITISGHTDSVGSASYNKNLSIKRANAVARYLTMRGVDGSRIKMQGLGATQPVDNNRTNTGRAHNRRIEIKIVN
jgi:outer membrane protein OmpA-like peptidoglycan-associated protein